MHGDSGDECRCTACGGDVMHRIIVKTAHGVAAAAEQLRDAGYEPLVGERSDEWGWTSIDFLAPPHEKLEFLRPHILPPLEVAS